MYWRNPWKKCAFLIVLYAVINIFIIYVGFLFYLELLNKNIFYLQLLQRFNYIHYKLTRTYILSFQQWDQFLCQVQQSLTLGHLPLLMMPLHLIMSLLSYVDNQSRKVNACVSYIYYSQHINRAVFRLHVYKGMKNSN